jgi:hypothetical protein
VDAQLEMQSHFSIHFLIRLRDDHLLLGLRPREEACGLAWNSADRQAGLLLKSVFGHTIATSSGEKGIAICSSPRMHRQSPSLAPVSCEPHLFGHVRARPGD